MSETKKQIKVSEVLQLLEEGKNRIQIGEILTITPREVKTLFEHPKLKKKKAKRTFVPTFNLVDDTEGEASDLESADEADNTSDTKFE